MDSDEATKKDARILLYNCYSLEFGAYKQGVFRMKNVKRMFKGDVFGVMENTAFLENANRLRRLAFKIDHDKNCPIRLAKEYDIIKEACGLVELDYNNSLFYASGILTRNEIDAILANL